MRTKALLLWCFFLLRTLQSASSTCTNELLSFIKSTDLPFNASSLRCVAALDFLGYSMLYEQSEPTLWSFVVTAPSNLSAYVGVGFSPTGRMVGSSAVVGWVWSNGTAVAKQYHLRGQRPRECVPDAGELSLVGGSTRLMVLPPRMYLSFQLRDTPRPRGRIIYAMGPSGFRPDSDLLLVEHQAAQSTIVDYDTGQSVQVKFSEKLKTIHGIVAMVGWGIFIPIGIMVARYGKRWDPTWFYSHLTIQSIGFTLGVTTIITGFKYEHKSLSDVDTHKAIGILITVLGVLQVMAFFLRPDKKAKIRRYWNWYHHNVGRIAFILAVGNIFYGFHLGDAVRPWRVAYIVFLCLLFILSVVFEVLICAN